MKDFSENIPNIDILLTFFTNFPENVMKKRIFPGVGVPHDGWASDLSEIRKEPKGFPFYFGYP